jgi:hypothetical protein
MANVKISALPDGTAAAGTTIPAVVGGVTSKVTTTAVGASVLQAANAAAAQTAIGVAPLASTAPAALAAAAAVGVGTTAARADHVHAIPGVSVGAVRGTVLIAAAQVNSVAADVATLVTDFNALLAKLRTAGVISP